MNQKSSKTPTGPKGANRRDDHQTRLAEALRANLQRRKDWARGRAALAAGAAAGPQGDTADQPGEDPAAT